MILFCLSGAASFAQSVTNGSFETDTFTIWPGYSSNNGPITDWTSTNTTRTGLNPASGSPFANNGAIPDGSNVAFIQNNAGNTGTLSQTITGLTAGETYRISYSYNSRSGAQDSRLQATMGATTLLQTPSTLFEVGGSNPYFYAGNEFTATGPSATLTFANINGAGDSTLLLDKVAIASASSDGLTTAAWTNDADSGVSSGWNYLAAANFGSVSNAVINGVTFTGAGAGSNPSGIGYSTSGLPNVVGADANNVTGAGASRVLANSFNFGGATETVTFTGLTAGRQYVADIYTVGWDASTAQIRNQTISDGAGGTVTINPNVHDNNNGLRLSYTYTATGATQAFTFTRQNAGTFHNYGVANRQNFLAWDDGVGSWFTGANWDAENNATIPGAGVTAVIDNGGTAQVTGSTASAGRLEVGGASSGTLDFSAGTLDIPTINLAVNGTFQASNTTTQTVNSTITGSGTVVKNGSGTLSLTNTAANTYSGGTTINAGILSLGTGGGVTSHQDALGTGAVTVNSGGELRLWIENSPLSPYTIDNAFTMDGGRVYAEDGIYNLSGNMTLAAGGGTLAGKWTGKTLTVSGVISGSGALTIDEQAGPQVGTVILSNNNSFTGNVAVNDGTLATGLDTRYSFGANNAGRTITVDGASSVLDVRHTNAITIGHGNEHNITLIAQNGGTIRNSGTAVNRIGDLTLDGGNLEANVNNANWGSWYFGTRNGGQDATVTVGSSAASTISGSGNIALGANTQFNVADGAAAVDLTVSTILTTGTSTGLAGGFTKLGAGTMALTAQSTHTGGTTVTGGTLDLVGQNILFGTGGLGNGSALTVDGGSSLVKLSATGINAMSNLGPLTLKNGGTFTDNGPAGGLHSVYAPVTFDGGGTMTSEVAGDGGFGNFLFINGIAVTGTPGLATIDAHSISFNFSQTLNVADSVAGSGTDLLISSSIRNQRVGTITKAGAGTVELTANNSVDTSSWTINAGTLKFNSAGENFATSGTLSASTGITVNSGGTLDVANTWNTAENGALTINGGTLNFSSGNDLNFVNNLTLNGATVTAGASSGFRAGYFRDATITVGGSSASTISSNLALADNAASRELTFDVADATSSAATDLTVSGVISDVASFAGADLIKTGAGTMALSGTAANTYTGPTVINAGTLLLQKTAGVNAIAGDITIGNGSGTDILRLGASNQIADTSVLSIHGPSSGNSGKFELNGFNETVGGIQDLAALSVIQVEETGTGKTSTLTINNSADYDFGGLIRDNASGSSTLSLVKEGAGTQTLSGVITYTGATTVDGGVLVLDESDNTYNGGDININNGATLRLDNQTGTYLLGANQNFNFGASGGNALEIVAGHNHVWSGANTVTTNGGSENTLSGSSINTNSGAAAGTLTFNVAAGSDASDLTVSSIIYNQGSVLKTGAGTLTFSSDMTYSGGTTVNGGELRLESGDATLNADSTLTIDGASSVVRLGPTVTGNNIFGSGPLFIQNGGTMIDDTPTPTVHSINGGLTFTNGGTLTSTGAGNGTFGNYFFGNGNLNVTGNAAATISAQSITIAGGRTVTVADVTGDANTDLTISSVVKNWGTNQSQVTKLGGGTLELTAQNTYTGATTINDGTLILSGGTNRLSGGSAITVDGAGSTLSLQGTANNVIQSWNALNIQNGASVSDDTSINAVHSLGTVTFDNGGSLSSTGNGNGAYGNYLFVGGVNVTGTGLATVDAHSVSFNFAQTVTVADTVAGSGTDLLISSAITNADGRVGNVTKAGSGTLELTGTNTDTSNYFVRAGTLVGGNNSAFGTGTITLNDASTGANDTSLFLAPTFDINNNIVVANLGTGTVTIGANGTDATANATTFNGTLQLNRDTTLTGSADQTLFANQISGNVGTLTIARSPDLTGTASGRVTFANGITNTFVGDIDIASHAILQSNGADNIPDASNVNVQANGRFQLAFNNETINGLTGAGVVSFFPTGGLGATTLTVGAGNNPSADFAGTIEDAGGDAFSLAKTGTGTQILSGANTYSGGTTIAFNGGTLELQHVSAAGTGTITQQDGNSWLVLNAAGTIANNFDIYRMRSLQNVELTGNITVNNATFDIAAPTVTTHSGDISGGGGVTKQGGGTLVLTGTNTYTGATTVEAGTLLINGNNSGATGAVTVEAGATLGGTGTIGGATTLAAGASLSPAGVDVGTLTLGGDLDIEQAVAAVDSDSMLFDLGSGASGDLVDVNGTLNIGSGLLEWDDFNFTTTALQTGVPAYTIFSAASITGTLGSNVFGVLDGLFARLRLDGSSIFLDLDADVPFPGDPNFNQFDFIPEPSRAMLLLFGFSATVLRRRR